MPYRKLYRDRQSQGIYLPRQWYVSDALDLQWVEGIALKATDALASDNLLGFIVKHNAGFMGGLTDNYTIVVAGDLPGPTERFVVIKELMHCYFDCEKQPGREMATDSAILLEALLRTFFGKSAESPSKQFEAEFRAFWMAMGVLVPEHIRQEWKAKKAANTITYANIAQMLVVPTTIVELLLSDQYDDELRHLLT